MTNNQNLLNEYLDKINFQGDRSPTFKNLAKILLLHAEKIPFGTLSFVLREPTSVDYFNIAEKLISKNRDGICLEQNTLLAKILNELGYEVRSILSRAYYGGIHKGIPPLIHLTNIVTIGDQDYLCDPSFGGITPTTPINIGIQNEEQITPLESFRIVDAQESGIVNEFLTDLPRMLQVKVNNEWLNMYAFDPDRKTYPIDIELAHWYITTVDDPIYSSILLVSKSTPTERTILHGLTMNTYSKEGVSSIKIESFSQFKNIILEKFNINTQALHNLSEVYQKLEKSA